jgi:hypothetical protein
MDGSHALDAPAAQDPDAYPPSPWRLKGLSYLALFRVPADYAPRLEKPLTGPGAFFGSPLVCVAWSSFGSEGDLAYDELLVAVLATHDGGKAFTAPQCWVDSPAAAAGGRALWTIPKGLGHFTRSDMTWRAETRDGRPIAELVLGDGTQRLGRRRFRFDLAQPDGEQLTRSRGELTGDLALAPLRWRFSPEGPLRWLAKSKPFVSARLDAAELTFGDDARRTA